MKKEVFTVAKGYFMKELQKVSAAVKDKSLLPVLVNFLFEIDGSILTVTGNNSEIQITTGIEVKEHDNGKFAFCIERSILDVLKALPEQPITLTVAHDTMSLTLSHASGDYQFTIISAEQYPKMDNVEKSTFRMPANNLKTALDKNIRQMADDELRPVMNGIFVDIKKDCVVFVGSDGHRMSKYVDRTLKDIDSKPFLLPRQAVIVLSKVITGCGNEEEIRIDSDYKNVAFTIGSTILTARLIEGKYPNYDSVIPWDNHKKLIVDSKEFTNIINRLLIVSNSSSRLIKVEARTDKTILHSEDIDFQRSAKEETHYACSENITIGFKGTFMLDLLSSVSDEIVMSFSTPDRALLIQPYKQEKDKELTLLLMPLMLD